MTHLPGCGLWPWWHWSLESRRPRGTGEPLELGTDAVSLLGSTGHFWKVPRDLSPCWGRRVPAGPARCLRLGQSCVPCPPWGSLARRTLPGAHSAAPAPAGPPAQGLGQAVPRPDALRGHFTLAGAVRPPSSRDTGQNLSEPRPSFPPPSGDTRTPGPHLAGVPTRVLSRRLSQPAARGGFSCVDCGASGDKP